MSFDWKEYIQVAEDLIKTPTPANLRSATSRAYYGVFCLCRNKAGLNLDKRPNIHNIVITQFKLSENKCENIIGNILDSLRAKRNEADYNGFFKPNLINTKRDIEYAKLILSNFEKILKEECD